MEDSDEEYQYSYPDSNSESSAGNSDDFALQAEVDTPQRRVRAGRTSAPDLKYSEQPFELLVQPDRCKAS